MQYLPCCSSVCSEMTTHLHRLAFAAVLIALLTLTAAERCRKPGDLICSPDCSSIQLCLSNSDSSFQHLDLEQCLPNTFCYAAKKACVSVNTCDPANLPDFECTKSTVMPDINDCTVFHVCRRINNTWEDSVVSCQGGYAFDSISKTCRLKLVDEPKQCSDGVPICRRQGEMLPYDYNKNLYILCKGSREILYPVLYECTSGQEFVEDGCKDAV